MGVTENVDKLLLQMEPLSTSFADHKELVLHYNKELEAIVLWRILSYC